jgi:hypothetical protein
LETFAQPAVDNPQQLNKAEFNKAAYLDLSKPYNGNNPQPVSKKYILS